jgi:hypothetical protein
MKRTAYDITIPQQTLKKRIYLRKSISIYLTYTIY